MVAALVVAAGVLAAPAAAEPRTHVVDALGAQWDPDAVAAVEGDTVEWRWKENVHDLWIVDAAVPLGEEAGVEQQLADMRVPGDPPDVRTFADAGAWDFYCKIHNGRGPEPHKMSGTITVREPDTVAPATTATLAPPAPGPGGTYAGPVTVTLSATDAGGSGLAGTGFRLDGGTQQDYTGPITVSAPGAHLITYASTDNDGNVEAERRLTFTIAAAGGGGTPPPPPPPPTPPPTGPGPVGDPPPAPAAALAPSAPRLRGAALAKGLRVRGTCADVAAGKARLTVRKRQARRLGLGKRTATLATARLTCRGGGFSARLKPKRKAQRALKRFRGTVKATLVVELAGAAGKARDRASFTVTGRKQKRR